MQLTFLLLHFKWKTLSSSSLYMRQTNFTQKCFIFSSLYLFKKMQRDCCAGVSSGTLSNKAMVSSLFKRCGPSGLLFFVAFSYFIIILQGFSIPSSSRSSVSFSCLVVNSNVPAKVPFHMEHKHQAPPLLTRTAARRNVDQKKNSWERESKSC